MAVPIIPIIAAIGSIVSSALAARSSRKQAERTNTANLELAKFGYGKDLEMWNRQNAYNDPSAQMARYDAAGLNPNLIYSQGSSGNSASMPRFDTPKADLHFSPFQMPETLSMYQDFQLRDAQIANVKAMTENTQQRTINESLKEWILGITGNVKEFDLTKMKALFPYQLQVQEGESRKVDAKVEQEYQQLMNMRRDELLKLLESYSLEKGLSMQDLQMEGKRADNLFAQFRNEWMKMGVTSSDHPLLRMFVRWMGNDAAPAAPDLIKKLVPGGPFKALHRGVDQMFE